MDESAVCCGAGLLACMFRSCFCVVLCPFLKYVLFCFPCCCFSLSFMYVRGEVRFLCDFWRAGAPRLRWTTDVSGLVGMSGTHCTPHWGATIHLKQKKVSFWKVTLGGASGDYGTSCVYNMCYLDWLWYSLKLVERRPSTGNSQVRRLVRPSCTISVTLLGTYAGILP